MILISRYNLMCMTRLWNNIHQVRWKSINCIIENYIMIMFVLLNYIDKCFISHEFSLM
jgi:hypothetical protein